ncbi:MAG: hypothetical protein ACOX5R_01820 [bacterium]
MRNRKKITFTIAALLLSLLLLLTGLEIILRLSDVLLSHSTQTLLDYGDTWIDYREGVGEGGFLKPNFNAQVAGGYGGKVHWQNNSAGFRSERDYIKQKPDNTYRILILGDSFTAGYRVDQHKTYGYLLEQNLETHRLIKEAEVLLSCIEDPAHGLYYLQQYGMQYHPDLIILAVTLGNDITETFLRVSERGDYSFELQDDSFIIEHNPKPETVEYWDELEELTLPQQVLAGSIQYQTTPPEESILHLSHVYRSLSGILNAKTIRNQPAAIASGRRLEHAPLFDLSSGLGYFLEEPPSIIAEAWHRFFEVLQAYKILASSSDTLFAVALHPQRFQVQPPDWQATIAFYQLKPEYFNLTFPNEAVRKACGENGIFLDPTDTMKEYYTTHRESLYFPNGDMHWNEAGHHLFARFLFEQIIQMHEN